MGGRRRTGSEAAGARDGCGGGPGRAARRDSVLRLAGRGRRPRAGSRGRRRGRWRTAGGGRQTAGDRGAQMGSAGSSIFYFFWINRGVHKNASEDVPFTVTIALRRFRKMPPKIKNARLRK